MKSKQQEIKRYLIDRASLPDQYPTHEHSAQFWEHLGRAIASFGFLEDMLKKAIFAFTATREYSEEEAKAAFDEWLRKLERTLSDTLCTLAKSYGKAVHEHQDSSVLQIDQVDILVDDIVNASKIRNVLCHGMWGLPDGKGMSLPRFFNKRSEVFETQVDVEFLIKVQRHVVELSCAVINSVSYTGWQFPGSSGPGKAI
jgi:hypothetical protein